MKLFFLYSMLLFMSCGQSRSQEKYDAIIITEFRNEYDIIGRLLNVEILKIQNMYYGANKDKAFTMTYTGSQHYEYKSDLEYTMKELSEPSNELKIIKYMDKTREELHLTNGQDTVMYTFDRYHDEDKPEYTRMKWKDPDDMSTTIDHETFYVYDENGNNTKRITTDFQMKESKQEIIRESKHSNKDTVITRTIINDTLQFIEKEFWDGKKKMKLLLDNKMNLLNSNTQYSENGLKIDVSKSIRSNGCCVIDSVYSKGDIRVKSSRIDSSDDMKIVITSEYDTKGNIVKEIMKTKHKVQ